jgi:myo-inositol-1-phosphate synthase
MSDKLSRRGDRSIRTAIAGVGNCASALVQGISFYTRNTETIDGLITPVIGSYRPHDVKIAAAFDIDRRKVGRTVEEAIFANPNCAEIFEPHPILTGIMVQMGPPLDGFPAHMADIQEADAYRIAELSPVDVTQVLVQAGIDVLVSYMPVGADRATKHYAQACLDAGVAFINAVPTFIASDQTWADRFRVAGLPIIGDDVKSQVGATILHRSLARLLLQRGYRVSDTYQLNFGGNTDFLNMLDRKRIVSKKQSKTGAVKAELPKIFDVRSVHVGPSDYVPSLRDKKIAYIHIAGNGFAGAPIEIEVKLTVQDSPNSAAVIMDAIRCAKLALDRGLVGPVEAACAYYMKSPPTQIPDEEARILLAKFVASDSESKGDC